MARSIAYMVTLVSVGLAVSGCADKRITVSLSSPAEAPAASRTLLLPTFRTTELTADRLRAEFETIPGHAVATSVFLVCSAVRAASGRGFTFFRMANQVSESSGPSVGQRKGSFEIELFNVPPAGAPVVGIGTALGAPETAVIDASSYAPWCALPTFQTRDLAPTRVRAELEIRGSSPKSVR
jgi:hypothetical protein